MDDCRPLWLGNLQHSADTSSIPSWTLNQTYRPQPNTLSPKDNLSVTYTSDYGSYSSQESNHSGNTSLYSNLLDCEEALQSQYLPYDLSPPAAATNYSSNTNSNMTTRKPKPLPPPRIDSRRFMYDSFSGLGNNTGTLEKKTSLDDLNITSDKKVGKVSPSSAEQSTPSYATLPRKKKLVKSDSQCSKTPSHSTTHVTWMKDIVQKEAALKAKKSDNVDGSPQNGIAVHGILKNKTQSSSPTATKQTEKPGYINRNTVQKILDQQRKASAKGRQTVNTNQFYKSMPSLQSNNHKTQNLISNQALFSKPWEHNSKGGSTIQTAQVLGVIEPRNNGFAYSQSEIQSQPYHHAKQNSTETEFEFPPPPSEKDIATIMSTPDINPQMERLELCTSKNEVQTLDGDNDPNSERDVRGSSLKAFIHTGASANRSKPTVPVKPQPHSKPGQFTQPQHTPYSPKYNSTPELRPDMETIKVKQCNAMGDIVIPPPLEFQENPTELSNNLPQQHTYGDYELLSPSATYNYPPSNDWNTNYRSYGGTNKQVNTQSKTPYQSHDTSVNSSRHAHNSYTRNDKTDLNRYYHTNNLIHPSYQLKNHTSHYHQYSTEL